MRRYFRVGIGALDEQFLSPGDLWRRIMEIDLLAPIEGTKIAIEQMKKQDPPGGVILQTASIAGIFPQPSSIIYSAAKGGLVHFTRSCWALENRNKIRVVAVCPAFFESDMTNNEMTRQQAKVVEGGMMTMEQIVDAFEEALINRSGKCVGGSVMQVRFGDGITFPQDLNGAQRNKRTAKL